MISAYTIRSGSKRSIHIYNRGVASTFRSFLPSKIIHTNSSRASAEVHHHYSRGFSSRLAHSHAHHHLRGLQSTRLFSSKSFLSTPDQDRDQNCIGLGLQMHHFESVKSTQDEARKMLHDSNHHGMCVHVVYAQSVMMCPLVLSSIMKILF